MSEPNSVPPSSAPAPAHKKSLEARTRATLLGTAAASQALRNHRGEQGVGAESVLQLYVLDGLLDAMEWARQGVGADDVACLWLGALRWVRDAEGSVPPGAPEPPSRWSQRALAFARGRTDGDPQNLRGLSSPEMSSPLRPGNRPAATVPELASTDGPGVVARAAALGLLPHVEPSELARLVRSAAAFSHGSPASHQGAVEAAELVRASADGVATTQAAIAVLLGRGLPEVSSLAAGAVHRAAESLGTVLVDPDCESRTSEQWAAVERLIDNDDEAALLAGALVGSLFGAGVVPGVEPQADAAITELARRFADAAQAPA